MNIHELNELITHLKKDAKGNKELITFYEGKRKKLFKILSNKIQTIINKK